MKSCRNVALGLFAACAGVANAAAVVDLDSSNFTTFMNSHVVVMTEFYAPWCGVCKDLEPLYEETASKLDASMDIKFARVDCVAEPDLCEDYRIRIYPTIYAFKSVEKREIYNGKREESAMITFAKKRYQPPVSILTKNTVEDFKTSGKAVVVGYWDAEDVTSNQTFTKVAESSLDDFESGATTDAALAAADGVKQPALVLYKQYDDSKIIYDGAFVEDDIKSFLREASIPLIGDLSSLSGDEINGRAVACIFADSDAEREQLGEEIRPIARKTKDSIRWVTGNAKTSVKFATKAHLKDGKWPALAIINGSDKYPFDQESAITRDAVSRFVNNYLENKIPPHVLGEPIPVQDGPVTIVVRDNFQKLVLDSQEDVLLEFYAPWCGHCKKLAPEYERLAQIYNEHGKKVIVAKVDATANDIPGHVISSYPTIKLFPGNAKDSPLQHKGNRTVEDLAQFVLDNGTSKVDIINALKATSAGDWVEAVKNAKGAAVDAITGIDRDEL